MVSICYNGWEITREHHMASACYNGREITREHHMVSICYNGREVSENTIWFAHVIMGGRYVKAPYGLYIL